MRKAVSLLALLGAALGREGMAGREYQRFDGHRVVSATIATPQQLRELRGSVAEIDVWSNDCVLVLGPGNDIKLAPGGEALLRSLNVTYEVKIDDVQAAVEATLSKANGTRKGKADPWFDNYHTYAELHNWYQEQAGVHGTIASWQGVAASVEGRTIGMLTIDASPNPQKKIAYIQAGIHAREWISPATTNYIVNELLTGYGTDSEITDLLNHITLHVVPVVNPDGYEFTWGNNRMWRKNRRPNGGSSFGVDLNRNYGSHWGCCGGSSGDPNSETYRGPSAFSEPESSGLSRIFTALKPNGGIDMHSYSQLLLRSWGWTRTDTPDEAALRALGEQMRASIAKPYGTQFTNQKSIDLYVTDGTASDWFYDPQEGAGAKWSYTIELRDTGRYGFLLPPDQIVPSGEETFLGIKDWLRHIKDN